MLSGGKHHRLVLPEIDLCRQVKTMDGSRCLTSFPRRKSNAIEGQPVSENFQPGRLLLSILRWAIILTLRLNKMKMRCLGNGVM